MTYLAFLGLFLLPAVAAVCVALLVLVRRTERTAVVARPRGRRDAVALIVVCCLALVWTTPWDSWIIGRGVWSYPDGRVIAALWRVPLEEYLFMVAQTLLLGLWTLLMLLVLQPRRSQVTDSRGPRWRVAACTGWLSVAVGGGWLATQGSHGDYLGSMLAWFAPLLALQQAVGADLLRRWRRVRWCALSPVVYLCAADRIAIATDVWRISPDHTSGFLLAGLPIEEALFFLITSMLVVNGTLLAAHPITWSRLRPARPVPAGTVLPKENVP